ncbi:MAG: NAD(P)-binding protein [Propionibacteriaceae bacterium]|jgi:NADPH-dependent glutamate synthase beta subunit-like oxidoreductase|nr:NAD(P)-binding protein [Propionibacteriaceae bacterium]
MADQRDITALPDLARGAGRVGPTRTRMPVYTDFLPPCNNACPAGENIQEYLRLVKEGQPRQAWLELVKNNPFPAIHGRVCYHPCENFCNRGFLDEAISIHGVERHLGDLALAEGWQFEQPETATGFRVLVVGAGPAGLAAAYHLARLGHTVEVRDGAPEPGGMMRYGIPEYRLPREVLDAEIDRVRRLGVVFTQNAVVKDLVADQAEGRFDAVFVAIGAGLSKRVDIPSMDASRLVDAVSFLKDVASGARPMVGRRVAVYGGGNTAMDAARVARRLGAEESIVIYRRTEAQMPAHEEEREEAKREGVDMRWLRTIQEVDSDGVKVEIMALDENGRAVGTGRYETLEADTVILAVGQEADSNFLRRIPGLRFENDVVIVDRVTLMTDVPGIFAGGDAVPSDRTVTVGVGHGKRAARMIDTWLYSRQPAPKAKHPLATYDMLHLWYFGDHDRRTQKELEVDERTGFQEIVRGLAPDEAVYEATRCLSCGNCIECDGCLGACPEGAVIKLGKGFRYRYDYEKCTGCASCYEQCPVHAIEMISEH